MPYTCVLWDVDGTIIDASDGILRRLNSTLTHFGKPAPSLEELGPWIGPPMYDSFQDMAGMTGPESAEAVAFYRELGKADGYTARTRVYPGVAELIRELDAAGVPQATASSKPEVQVVALMEHYGLAAHFTALVGATPDERTLSAKSAIITEALSRLASAGVDTSRPVLIGDRKYDVAGGMSTGVPVIFARWGFSTPEEAEGAVAAVDNVHELERLLRGA